MLQKNSFYYGNILIVVQNRVDRQWGVFRFSPSDLVEGVVIKIGIVTPSPTERYRCRKSLWFRNTWTIRYDKGCKGRCGRSGFGGCDCFRNNRLLYVFWHKDIKKNSILSCSTPEYLAIFILSMLFSTLFIVIGPNGLVRSFREAVVLNTPLENEEIGEGSLKKKPKGKK